MRDGLGGEGGDGVHKYISQIVAPVQGSEHHGAASCIGWGKATITRQL